MRIFSEVFGYQYQGVRIYDYLCGGMTSFVISSPFSLSQTEIPNYHTVQQCYASTRTAQWPSIITVTELHWKLVSHTGSIILQEMNSKMLRLFKLFFLISVVSAYSIRNSIRKVVLKAGGGKKLREKVSH